MPRAWSSLPHGTFGGSCFGEDEIETIFFWKVKRPDHAQTPSQRSRSWQKLQQSKIVRIVFQGANTYSQENMCANGVKRFSKAQTNSSYRENRDIGKHLLGVVRDVKGSGDYDRAANLSAFHKEKEFLEQALPIIKQRAEDGEVALIRRKLANFVQMTKFLEQAGSSTVARQSFGCLWRVRRLPEFGAMVRKGSRWCRFRKVSEGSGARWFRRVLV